MGAAPRDRFRRVDYIIDMVLDLPPDEQDAFVNLACGNDVEIREEVNRVLHAYRRSSTFSGTRETENTADSRSPEEAGGPRDTAGAEGDELRDRDDPATNTDAH